MTSIVKGEELGDVKKGTLNEMFWNSVENNADIVAVKYRSNGNITEVTYREYGEKVRKLSQGLISLGIEKDDKVSILSETRYEWGIADFAILTAGGVTVTIYPTLTSKSAKFILDNSDSKIIFVENQEQLDKILEVQEELPELTHIITFEKIDSAQENILSLEQAMKWGEKFEAEHPGRYEEIWKSVKPDDLCSLVYTSGTTGWPKGTMLSHWNFKFNVITATSLIYFEPGDVLMVFLPLAHVYMRCVYFAAIYAGTTAFFTNTQQLVEDLPEVMPDAFVSVPRLFERVYDRLTDQMEEESFLKKNLFYWAAGVARETGYYESQNESLPTKLRLKHRLADKLVYSKIRQRIGVDQLKWTVSAGSALSKKVAYFFSGIGITILEGYGMTETGAPSNLNPINKRKPGKVGPPLPGTQQKLAEDGELLVKGDHVMQGYYKLPEETREAFTEDGWLKTGDSGYFDEDGYFVFKERKKHILVLSTGKNVAPLPIEEELLKERPVEIAIVIGDNQKFVSALIQPSFDYLVDYAEKNNIPFNKELIEYDEGPGGDNTIVKVDPKLLQDENVIHMYQKMIDRINENYEDYEKIKKYVLLPEALSVQSGELTPTLKVKRKVIIDKYNEYIQQMYE